MNKLHINGKRWIGFIHRFEAHEVNGLIMRIIIYISVNGFVTVCAMTPQISSNSTIKCISGYNRDFFDRPNEEVNRLLCRDYLSARIRMCKLGNVWCNYDNRVRDAEILAILDDGKCSIREIFSLFFFLREMKENSLYSRYLKIGSSTRLGSLTRERICFSYSRKISTISGKETWGRSFCRRAKSGTTYTFFLGPLFCDKRFVLVFPFPIKIILRDTNQGNLLYDWCYLFSNTDVKKNLHDLDNVSVDETTMITYK